MTFMRTIPFSWLRHGRRRIPWENVRTPYDFLALIISTFFGAGLAPFAPGTFGTLAAVPIAFLTAHWEWGWRLAFWALLFLAGVWGAQRFDHLCETQDNQNIVIDEVVGLAVTAWPAATDFKSFLAAFVLFRLFDILKPPPVRHIDRWSHRREQSLERIAGAIASPKRSSNYWGGFGVMADDLAAGLQGLLVMLLLQYWNILPPASF
jgi:phosphatidylglycerophosphatase A